MPRATETGEGSAGPEGSRARPAPPLLVEHAGLVGGDHVLDVDEGVLPAIALERFQRLLDQVADVLPLLLAVVDAVSRVHWCGENTQRARYCAVSPKSPTHPLGIFSECLLGDTSM